MKKLKLPNTLKLGSITLAKHNDDPDDGLYLGGNLMLRIMNLGDLVTVAVSLAPMRLIGFGHERFIYETGSNLDDAIFKLETKCNSIADEARIAAFVAGYL